MSMSDTDSFGFNVNSHLTLKAVDKLFLVGILSSDQKEMVDKMLGLPVRGESDQKSDNSKVAEIFQLYNNNKISELRYLAFIKSEALEKSKTHNVRIKETLSDLHKNGYLNIRQYYSLVDSLYNGADQVIDSSYVPTEEVSRIKETAVETIQRIVIVSYINGGK